MEKIIIYSESALNFGYNGQTMHDLGSKSNEDEENKLIFNLAHIVLELFKLKQTMHDLGSKSNEDEENKLFFNLAHIVLELFKLKQTMHGLDAKWSENYKNVRYFDLGYIVLEKRKMTSKMENRMHVESRGVHGNIRNDCVYE
ncbi:hypothetical protein OUZ56_027819 [Daphnia magna]|uniref:Uncharacterized protein n=1 Tax=Daphnia magna TaxID=35525 RepID=A0ABR0B214_9CRUS|nr:hypothetical protein OUZ56_027819 [Daphnia magna]